ncbi:hypothetical protein GCM10023192_56190 [Amycolatopsis samaneae]
MGSVAEFFDTAGLGLLGRGFALSRQNGEWRLYSRRRCVLLPYAAADTAGVAWLVGALTRGAGLEPVATEAVQAGECAGVAAVVHALGQRLVRPERPPDGSARGRLLVALRSSIDTLAEADVDVRLGEPAAVTHLRDAARRTRGLLGAGAPVLGGRRLGAGIRRELHWFAGELAPARGTEVLAPRLRRRLTAVPAHSAHDHTRERIAGSFVTDGRARVFGAIGSRRYLQVLDALDVLEVVLAETPSRRWAKAARRPAETELPGLAAPWAAKATRHLRAAARTPGRDRELSHVRHAVEKFRCLRDASFPAGAEPSQVAARLDAVTALLEEHHTAVLAQAHLRRLTAQAIEAGEDPVTFEKLLRAEREAVEETAARIPGAWRAVHSASSPLWTEGT